MRREVALTEGQQRCWARLRSAGRRWVRGGRLVVVRGTSGIGKSTLLEVAARRWRRSEGMRVVHARFAACGDRTGIGSIVDALRGEFGRCGDAELIDVISTLTELRAREAESAGRRCVAPEVGGVFTRLGRAGTTAVLLDDVQHLADPAALLVAARRPGCLVVASVREDLDPVALAEVLSLADDVVDVERVSEPEIGPVVGGLDDAARTALRAALGSLCGNPGTVLATVAMLRTQGRLVSVDGRLRLVGSGAAIPLPEGHELLRRTRALGHLAVRLLAAVAIHGGLDIDDLAVMARSVREGESACGRALDELVEVGALVGDGHGKWVCRCPALAAAVAREARGRVAGLSRTTETMGDRVASWIDVPGKTGRVRYRGAGRSSADQLSNPARQRWSPTEIRIVDLVGRGCTNRRIAAEIGVGEKTVERYLTRLFVKIGCRSRAELVSAGMWATCGA